MGPLRMRQRQGGFTLIELMVVVAIVAFVSAAVVPSMSLRLLRNRQREAANLIIQGVFAARSRAARTGRCPQVQVSLSNANILGGNGGGVAVLTGRLGFRCSQAEALGEFLNNNNLLWVKSIGGANLFNANRAGIVGDDVAILQATAVDGAGVATNFAAGATVTINFEPSGGMQNGSNYVFLLPAYDRGGQLVGNMRCIALRAGGTVRYGMIQAGVCQ